MLVSIYLKLTKKVVFAVNNSMSVEGGLKKKIKLIGPSSDLPLSARIGRRLPAVRGEERCSVALSCHFLDGEWGLKP